MNAIEMIHKQMDGKPSGSLENSIGGILIEICKKSLKAEELLAQDLTVAELSLTACGKAIYKYAEKHHKGNSWSCPVFELSIENPVIKVILDFYKIPPEWLGAPASAPKATPKVRNLLDFI